MGETSLKDLTTGSETKFEEACPEKYVKACFEEDAEVIRAATPEAILKLAATLQNLVNVGMKLPGSLGTSCPLCSSRGQGIFGPGAGGPGRLQPRPARTRPRTEAEPIYFPLGRSSAPRGFGGAGVRSPPLRPRELHSEVDALLVPEGGLADDASELQVSSSQPVSLQSLMSVFKAGLVMHAFHAVVLRSEDTAMEIFYEESEGEDGGDHAVADAWEYVVKIQWDCEGLNIQRCSLIAGAGGWGWGAED